MQAKSPTIFPVSNTARADSSGGVSTLGLYFLSQSTLGHWMPFV
ncbi:hypothetical protein N5U05_04535 [Aliarcobacter butzleri]|nr:hypothetical protein [Aliarcobacter butzleri]MCT7617002.1 hypothetical protein [Aliarcobacter butzleri]